jgi:hypothetical protein
MAAHGALTPRRALMMGAAACCGRVETEPAP